MELGGCPFPEDAHFDAEHDVWVRAAPTPGVYRLGITSSLSAFAGRILAIRHRTVGAELHPGESVATIESLRYTGAVRLPLTGVGAVPNRAIVARPRLLNDSPYEEGWVIEFRPVHPAEVDRLPRGRAATEALTSRIAVLRVRCEGPVPDVEVVELGSDCSAVLARLDTELALRAPGDILRLVSDDPTSPLEMVRWADRTGHTVLGSYREGTVHRFLVRREASPTPRTRSAETGRV
ncbi:MAG: hypothetical protein L3J72_02070 [Thermoplasmata archaeon]|nr:hypothetical protein [Thermoplasmata archaeon]